MKNRTVLRMAAALLTLVAMGGMRVHADAKDTAAAKYAVKIDNYSFTPQTITVPAGTTVTWTNADDVPHTVAASDMAFHSKAMDTDEQYSHTFDAPGTYKYFCTVHPKMQGTVIVLEKK
ncbi:MAG TPA: cupredoxin family copper-binding protein [Terriglobales bacterium]|nr:cupredoxin family copper-binding protein [Terriglobales bacterium]